jgi:3',5'-cyclic AMP phosphodiesterase CpdA
MATIVITAVMGLYVQAAELPKLLGNNAENLNYVSTRIDPNNFTFIMAGDTKRGTATFSNMLDLMRADKPAFAVILGDFVSELKLIRHQHFINKMARLALPYPVFLVPGNHNIHPNEPINEKGYEQIYGAAQFHFSIGQNLFVFLNDAPFYDETEQYLKFLEETVSERAKQVQNIFVFMHVPPSGLNPWIQASGCYNSEEFMQLAKELGIRYVFTGHHHGYIKTVKNGTTYIVTGGGGDRLRGIHGRFHHLTRIAVQNRMITETVILGEKRFEALNHLEHNIVIHLWPFISKDFVSIAVTIILFGIVIWLLVFSVRGLRSINRTEMPV